MKLHRTEKSYSFFNRMLLICVLMLAAFSITASTIVAYTSHKYEESQFLKSYEMAAINLSETIDNRFSDFILLTGKLLDGVKCNPDLCTLLETAVYEDVPAPTRRNCIDLLSTLCQEDRYLSGFLLFSPENQNLFYYTDTQSHLFHTDTVSEISDLSPFSGSTLALDDVNSLISLCTGTENSNSYYGIAATIYRTPAFPLGYLIPLFSTSEFQGVLTGFDLSMESTFYINDPNGGLFFNSNPSLKPDIKHFYTYTLQNARHDFEITYYVRKMSLPHGSITYLVILLAVLVTLFSFVVYFISYLLSHRSINGILHGMKQLNGSDLTYRIEKTSGHNEFTQIIDGFNAMCDELQRNVERSYVYELQQKKSELYALQTSINPHFLYNTLEMIRIQILNARPNEASQMILLLSKIYRLQTNTSMFISLEDEVELCINLMSLYQYRFQNFDYECDIDDSVLRYAIPKNTLQPLIENYFVHGIVASRQDNLLLLTAELKNISEKNYVHLTLCNNGNPITAEYAHELEEKLRENIYASKDAVGFALTNVSNRLRIVFQNDCEINISPGNDDMSFQIELIYPALTIEQLQKSFS